MIFFFSVSSSSGKHWFAIFCESKNEIQVFDSLGVSQSFIEHNFSNLAERAIGNETAVQPLNSKLCGEFTLFFLLHRYLSIDLTFDELMNAVFSTDLQKNEAIVLEFLENEHHGK